MGHRRPGRVRPHQGGLIVASYTHATTKVKVSVADGKQLGAEWIPEDASDGSEGPDKSWKVAELVAFAAEKQIDLGDATKKDDILAVLVAAAAGDDEDEVEDES